MEYHLNVCQYLLLHRNTTAGPAHILKVIQLLVYVFERCFTHNQVSVFEQVFKEIELPYFQILHSCKNNNNKKQQQWIGVPKVYAI